MRWPWQRRSHDRSDEARGLLAELDEREPRVDRLASELDRARERNHFAEMIRAAFAARREA